MARMAHDENLALVTGAAGWLDSDLVQTLAKGLDHAALQGI